ncbi:GrpB family protein [Ensifer sp. P24N7]|uniref:GrpB family protein n=1 Tax=Sinorhizobium sp. P24N7 TaxID=3348358 RepID=UPI0035F34C1D
MPSLVELVPYDTNWLKDFSAAEALLRTTLRKCVLAVDHIGSTAVPGLAAKPMLDIDVTLSGLADIPDASANLIKAGFEPRGNRYDVNVCAFLLKRLRLRSGSTSARPQTRPTNSGCFSEIIFVNMTTWLLHTWP